MTRPTGVYDVQGTDVWERDVVQLSLGNQEPIVGCVEYWPIEEVFMVATKLDADGDGDLIELRDLLMWGYELKVVGNTTSLQELLALR